MLLKRKAEAFCMAFHHPLYNEETGSNSALEPLTLLAMVLNTTNNWIEKTSEMKT